MSSVAPAATATTAASWATEPNASAGVTSEAARLERDDTAPKPKPHPPPEDPRR